MKTGLLLIALLLLALWFQTTPTFCRWMANRNFQARMGGAAWADDLLNDDGDVVAQTLESHYDYSHSCDKKDVVDIQSIREKIVGRSVESFMEEITATEPNNYEDRDPNYPIICFAIDGKEVILDTDPNGSLYMKFVNCNEVEAGKVVWEAASTLMKQITYTAEYMRELVNAMSKGEQR